MLLEHVLAYMASRDDRCDFGKILGSRLRTAVCGIPLITVGRGQYLFEKVA